MQQSLKRATLLAGVLALVVEHAVENCQDAAVQVLAVQSQSTLLHLQEAVEVLQQNLLVALCQESRE